MFYPGNPVELRHMLSEMLDSVDDTEPVPKAIIAPHAGYIYSGTVAATAYARLKPAHDKIKRVILMGPTHRVAVRGLATVSVDGFDTPLGSIPLDRPAIEKALELPQVGLSDVAHAQEHSLEVHLPFLQTCLDDFKLVPFAVGEATAQEVAEVLELLWGGPETLIVISSDLSHFLDYDSATSKDHKTSKAIEELRYEDLAYDDACGRNPVKGLLFLARKHHYSVQNIDLRNSGDTAGPRDSVVGYGSYVLSETHDKPVKEDEPIAGTRYTPDEGQALIGIAKSAIEHALKTGKAPTLNLNDFDPHLRENRASFVTLNRNGQLRGCIGSLQAYQPLVNDVAHNAVAAAFKDPRFPPLSEQEKDDLDIHVSILSLPEPVSFTSEEDLIRQIRPGIDGLILEDRGHRGTFLPSVWDSLPEADQFWRELKRKAGLPYTHWSDTLTVQRYTTQAFS
jgi:AmmeMemoRadiSam system protein B/AmmeMemoRadiSam system protein A